MTVPAAAAALPPTVSSSALRAWLTYLSVMCAAVGLLIALSNPNFRWSAHREVPYGADFLQEWIAGDMLLSGAGSRIYDPVAFRAWQHDVSRIGFAWPESEYYPAVYPPPYYCLVAPLAALPYRAAAVMWLVLMLGAYIAAVGLIQWPRAACVSPRVVGRSELLFWSVVLLFPALFIGLVMGQKGTLWLLLAALTWQLWRTEKTLLAGCVWALLSIKPTLCFLLPLVMLFRGQWRFMFGFSVGVLLLWGATALLVPVSMWSDYWQVVAGTATYQAHGGYRDGWSVSLWSLLQACGIWRELVVLIWLSGAVAMTAALVKLPAVLGKEKLEQSEFLLRVLGATALLSPHFYYYDLVWLLLPLHGLWLVQPRRGVAIITALWLSMVIVQGHDQGWPLVGATLLAILFHATFSAANCGTSFANTSIARSQ